MYPANQTWVFNNLGASQWVNLLLTVQMQQGQINALIAELSAIKQKTANLR